MNNVGTMEELPSILVTGLLGYAISLLGPTSMLALKLDPLGCVLALQW